MMLTSARASQGTVLAAVFFSLFFAAYGAQLLIDPWFNYVPGVALVYLPAGIKLLAFVVGGVWGALGLFVAGVLTVPFVLHDLHAPSVYEVSRTALWVAAPYFTFVLIKHWRGLNGNLVGLTHADIVLIGVGTTAASVMTSLVYDAMWFERAPEMVQSAMLAMALGDIIGIVVVLSLTRCAVSAFRQAYPSRL